jgi:hypothetical protein
MFRKSCLSISACVVLAVLGAGCTRAELEHKTDAYNQAIAESNNRQILLNAVRASQRAPMSFVGFGQMQASPNFSGAANSTFNLDPFGLTTYSANPQVNYNGGFSTFAIDNLNTSQFAIELQKHIKRDEVRHFVGLRFPKELLSLIFVQEYHISAGERLRLDRDARRWCDIRNDQRSSEFCGQLKRDRETFQEQCPGELLDTDGVVLNTARDQCSMIKVQMLTRQARLLHRENELRPVARTRQGVLYYLGELIAAQNYSPYPYKPQLFTVTADSKHRLVPVFEVKRGAPAPGEAAVSVTYNGEGFYIPRPALGDVVEARSLQVLDLVSMLLVLTTNKDALPKATTLTLVPAR